MERLNLTKQQLILARKFFLELQRETEEQGQLTTEDFAPQLSLKRFKSNIKR